jgi:hypothetical protein
MDLPQQNAHYIKQLNKNNQIFDSNMTHLDKRLALAEEMLSTIARDAAAMQRAIVDLLKHKGIIEGESDMRLLQKFQIQNIAQLDQEITERKQKKKSEEEGLPPI